MHLQHSWTCSLLLPSVVSKCRMRPWLPSAHHRRLRRVHWRANTKAHLIRTFAKLLQRKDLPVVVLFCSRRESQIQMAFNARDMGGFFSSYRSTTTTKRPVNERDAERLEGQTLRDTRGGSHCYDPNPVRSFPIPYALRRLVPNNRGTDLKQL